MKNKDPNFLFPVENITTILAKIIETLLANNASICCSNNFIYDQLIIWLTTIEQRTRILFTGFALMQFCLERLWKNLTQFEKKFDTDS